MEEEKETEEEEEDLHHIPVEHQELPIMHWEELSQRIAELEKQEEERKEKRRAGLRTEDGRGVDWRDVWEEDVRRSRLAVAASRLKNQKKLQLCFINDSNSEEEEEEEGDRKVAMGAGHNGCHGGGLKQEVAAALRALRDELLMELKKEENQNQASSTTSSRLVQQKPVERWELQHLRLQQLSSLRASLQQDVHALSSELVAQLLVRDQLRTKQDAMLLDVQDLT